MEIKIEVHFMTWEKKKKPQTIDGFPITTRQTDKKKNNIKQDKIKNDHFSSTFRNFNVSRFIE